MSNFKNPFAAEKRIPLPRLRGNAVRRPDHTWTWEMDIFVGEEYVASMKHPEEAPGFLAKETAIADLKKHAIEAGNLISREAYGVEKPDGYFDFKTNELVTKIE